MAEYQLFSDKATTFECRLELEGASMQGAVARIVLEGADKALLFRGTISKDGQCSVPLPRLKGLMEDHSTGTMRLEVIAEDTYFPAWESEFIVTPSKKLTVEVANSAPSKPSGVRVTLKEGTLKEANPISVVTSEVVGMLRTLDIDAKNVLRNKTTVRGLIAESVEKHGIKNVEMDQLISSIVKTLAQR